MWTTKLPTGYRFIPTDEDLVVHYLMNKVLEKPLPAPVVQDLQAIELFTKPPNQFCAGCGGDGQRDWFFFLFEDENYRKMEDMFEGYWRKSTHQVHHSFEGYWRKLSEDIYNIYDSNGNLLGLKEMFCYYIGKDEEAAKKTHWKHEKYRLSSCEKDRWVLIKIIRGEDVQGEEMEGEL